MRRLQTRSIDATAIESTQRSCLARVSCALTRIAARSIARSRPVRQVAALLTITLCPKRPCVATAQRILPADVARAEAVRRDVAAMDVYSELRGLRLKALRLIVNSEQSGDAAGALSAMREMRKYLETLERIDQTRRRGHDGPCPCEQCSAWLKDQLRQFVSAALSGERVPAHVLAVASLNGSTRVADDDLDNL